MKNIHNAEKIDVIFSNCLFKKGDDASKCITVDGNGRTVKFYADRLNAHEVEIEEILSELPEKFKWFYGGGTFEDACNDKNSEEWTGFEFEQEVEPLFELGIALGRVEYCKPIYIIV